MSCEQELSGTDLKIIQYSIVNVNPYIDDCDEDERKKGEVTKGEVKEGEGNEEEQAETKAGWNRRVLFTDTISTTQDMTEADFTAWVIALNFQRPEARKVKHCDKQYLRVCYTVQCRLPVPEANYPKRQVEVLERMLKKM